MDQQPSTSQQPGETQVATSLFADEKQLRGDVKLLEERVKLAERFPITPEIRQNLVHLVKLGMERVEQFANANPGKKIDRSLRRIQQTIIDMDRLNMAQEIQVLGAANTQPAGVTVNVNQQTAVVSQQPAAPFDPAAAAREILANDPGYVEYLREKASPGAVEPGAVGPAVQPGLLADVPPPPDRGSAPDRSGDRTDSAAADDPGAAGARQDPAA